MEAQHENEMRALEEKYGKDNLDDDQEWSNKMREFEEKSRKMEEEMNFRHKSEMENLVKTLETSSPGNIKYPPEYLHLKRSEELLAKQQRFKEADFAKLKKLEIEKKEIEKYKIGKNNKFQGKIEKLASKQTLERNALKKKIETGIEIMQGEKKVGTDT